MTTSNRDKILVMILPALLTLLAYLYWFFFPIRGEILKAYNELRSLQARQPSLAQLQLKAARVSQLKDDLERCQQQKQDLEKQWQALVGGGAETGRRSLKIEGLTALLKQHGLNILEQAQAEGSKESNMPPALAGVVKRMSEAGEQHRPQVWRFRVQGSYLSLLRVLSRLGQGDTLVIPLSLTMKEAEWHSDVREWTLLLWI